MKGKGSTMKRIDSMTQTMLAVVMTVVAATFGQSWTVSGDLAVKGHVSGKNVSGVVVDMDGNVYHTVVIGNQEWTVENIRTTTLNDGTPILAWSEATPPDPAYCYYNNSTDPAEQQRWGALYNGYAVATGKLAPPPQAATPAATDWHVPNDSDWTVLENYLIANGYNYDGTTTGNKIGKSMATGVWTTNSGTGAVGNDLSLNNRSGFSGLPGGCRGDAGYAHRGKFGNWWSNVTYVGPYWIARYRYLGFDDGKLNALSAWEQRGYSVRLVRYMN